MSETLKTSTQKRPILPFRIRFEPRLEQPPRWYPFMVSLLAIVISLAIGGVIISLAGGNPFRSYAHIARASFGDIGVISDTIVKATPIILAGLGLPFLLIFLTDRKHWWALIPGMTMIGVAAAVFLEGVGVISDEAVGGLVVGGIALGFLLIYLIDRKQWWALIPGGIMGTVAFFLLVATVIEYVWPVALILLGLLLLRSGLVGGRQRPRGAERVSAPTPPPPEPAKRERQRLPTLEEQIEEAIAQEPEVVEEAEVVTEPEPEGQAPEPSVDAPPAPEVPESPDEPAPAAD